MPNRRQLIIHINFDSERDLASDDIFVARNAPRWSYAIKDELGLDEAHAIVSFEVHDAPPPAQQPSAPASATTTTPVRYVSNRHPDTIRRRGYAIRHIAAPGSSQPICPSRLKGSIVLTGSLDQYLLCSRCEDVDAESKSTFDPFAPKQPD